MMTDFFPKGIVLEQNKEPALSRDLRDFFSGSPMSYMDRAAVTNTENIDPDDVIDIAREAQIIDETDGAPLYKKLIWGKNKAIVTVIGDAIDDEPYISSQLNPALKLSKEMAGGLRLVQKTVSANDAYVAVYKNLADLNTRIPGNIEGIPVNRVSGRYPAQEQAKRRLKGRKTLIVGTCALIHLYRAVYENRIQTTCFVTVAGNCIANPLNLEVSIGVTVMQLLERCGLAEEPSRVVVGGSMTGYGVLNTEKTVVGVMTRGILAFKEFFKEMNYKCIGCGKCAAVCPEGLSPYYLYNFITQKRYKYIDAFDVDKCIGCGTCSYICPAKLDIATVIFDAKRKVAQIKEEDDE